MNRNIWINRESFFNRLHSNIEVFTFKYYIVTKSRARESLESCFFRRKRFNLILTIRGAISEVTQVSLQQVDVGKSSANSSQTCYWYVFTTLCDLYVVQQCKITVDKSERPADERVYLTSFNGELNKTF